MKRRILILFVICILVPALAFCNPIKGKTEQEKIVKFIEQLLKSETFIQQIKKYQKEDPNWKVHPEKRWQIFLKEGYHYEKHHKVYEYGLFFFADETGAKCFAYVINEELETRYIVSEWKHFFGDEHVKKDQCTGATLTLEQVKTAIIIAMNQS